MNFFRKGILIVMCLTTLNVYALEGKIKGGYHRTQGNVNVERLSVRGDLIFKGVENKAQITMHTEIGSSNKQQNAKEYGWAIHNEYRYGQTKHGGYGKLNYLTNQFKGIDNQWELDLGYLFYAHEQLKFRLGLSHAFENNINYVKAGLMGQHKLADNVISKIKIDYGVDPNFRDDYALDVYVSAVFKVNTFLDLESGITREYKSIPYVTEAKKIDIKYVTSLIWNI